MIYYTEFKKHSSFYNFYDSEKCVDDFLRNVKYRFKSTNKKWLKCSFNIENTQNCIRPNLQPLSNTIYWTTEANDSIYFNDFCFFIVSILLSGSSWYFKRFVYLAVKILDGEVEISI